MLWLFDITDVNSLQPLWAWVCTIQSFFQIFYIYFFIYTRPILISSRGYSTRLIRLFNFFFFFYRSSISLLANQTIIFCFLFFLNSLWPSHLIYNHRSIFLHLWRLFRHLKWKFITQLNYHLKFHCQPQLLMTHNYYCVRLHFLLF